MSVPPELRVLCRRLDLTSTERLPAIVPSLVEHVSRCQAVLSAPHETKGKDKPSAEAAQLVYRFRTHINTLLNGRNAAGRLTAVVLVKAVVDVSGWEGLRDSATWVRGLLSILNRRDPPVVKELCIVALTKIYILLHPFQTLLKEIATPTLPDFAKSCLQILQPEATSQLSKTPVALLETVVSALLATVPLYPTTLRTFSSPIRSICRKYIAPTPSDLVVVSQALQISSRRLLIALHHTSPKNGGAEEWALLLDELIRTIHLTADQTFRSVKEFWESTAGYVPSSVDLTQETHGGGVKQGELPEWSGVSSGIARISGLVQTITECFANSTRMPVLFSIDALLDVCSRLTSIVPPEIGGYNKLGDLNVNPNVGREERDELWSSLPSVHQSVLDLFRVLLRRLGNTIIPAIPDMLSMASRSFATMATCDDNIQKHGYQAIEELLLLAGPVLPKTSVMLLRPVTQLCCDVLLRAAGYPKADDGLAGAQLNGTKANGLAANADSIFPKEKASSAPATHHSRQAGHLMAASKLLPVLLTHLPQRYLSQDQRALIDRTAIVTKNRDAMLASCLHPYTDARGRLFSSITPFLCQAFPDDQAVEILKSNMISTPNAADMDLDPGEADGESEDLIDSVASLGQAVGRDASAGAHDTRSQGTPALEYPDQVSADRTQTHLHVREQSLTDIDMVPSAHPKSLLSGKSEYGPSVAFIQTNSLKRGIEEVDTDVTDKPIDAGRTSTQVLTGSATLAGSDSSDGEDAQLDMTLELDEEDSEMEE